MRRFAPPAPLLAAGLALALGIGCGRGDDVPTPGEAPPAVFGRQPAEKGPGPWTATHILIAARNPKMLEVERSKIQAEDAARVVMKKLEAGTKFDELVAVYTDDKASIGPNRPGRIDGQYEFPAGVMVPAFEQAVRETPVGRIHPVPVETPFGYHIIRRDK